MRWRTALFGLIPLSFIAGCAGSHANSTPDATQTQFTARTYFAAGELAESQQNWQRALSEYRLSLTARGPHAPALYRIAVIYTNLKEYPEAIEAWNQYVAGTYGAALAYGDLAYACELAGKYADARNAYQSALKKEPANPTIRVNYGLMLARQGDIAGSQDQLHSILPEAQVHYQIGIICQEKKNTIEARAQFDQAIALNPQLLDAKARLADLNTVSSVQP